MSTLATFVSTLGFKMDDSFDKAMLNVNKRLGALGNSLGGAGGQLSKSIEAASRRVQAAQMNMQAQALKSESAKMAMSDKQHASELKRISSIKDTEVRLAATKALNAERERTAQIRHENTMAARREGNLLKEVTLKLRERQQGFREEQAHIRRTGASGGRGGSGVGLGGLGGIPIAGRTTLGTFAGAFGLSELVRQSYQMANYSAGVLPSLKYVTGSQDSAERQKGFIEKESERLGISRVTATQQYTHLLASTIKPLGEQGSQDLFSGIQNLSTVLGVSEDAQHRAILALTQMAGKNQIMA